MKPAISLIITVYNRERYLSAAIESILAQSRGDFELLIWDDGSRDNSVAIAQTYAQQDNRVRVIAAKHQGRGKALNAAISQTTAPYLGWVDSDDLLAATALAETAAVLDNKPDIGWVYTDYFDIDTYNNILSYGYRSLVPYSPEELLNKFMTFHFRLIRRQIFDLVGGIDTATETVEDYDLCLRLSEVAKVWHIPKPLYYYRAHVESLSRTHQLEQIKKSHQAVKNAQQRRKLKAEFKTKAGVYLSNNLFKAEGKRQKEVIAVSTNIRTVFGAQNKRRANLNSALFTQHFALCFSSLLLPFYFLLSSSFATAQTITPANDGTGTVVTPNGNNINISSGTLSGNNTNLFHSFSEFGLNQNQTANFLSNPSIQNILGRVTGGNASSINGIITVTGGNSNLFLINPSGFIFGANASLNLPASFTAITANSINFGNNLFNANGLNNYTTLNGNPDSFGFNSNAISAIINQGNLGVKPGNNLTLIGGTVVSTGNLSTPGGNITVAAVPGTSLVRINIPGNPISLEIKPINTLPNHNQAVNNLPALLTGGGGINATQLQVTGNGEVQLIGSGLRVENGDVVVKNVNAGTATLSANNNLTLPESQLSTTGNMNLLAGNTVRVRDSAANAFSANAGGNLYIRSNQNIDILALNHLLKEPFIAGGDLSLVSDGVISGDAHFVSNGKFSVLNTQGKPGNFVSLFDPIISSNQDVILGNYTGAALKVESRGSITAGNITINSSDFNLTSFCSEAACSTDAQILAAEPALILRAGVTNLQETNFGQVPFSNSGVTSSPANVNVGNIIVGRLSETFSYGGPVIITAPGNIQTGNINTDANQSGLARGGRVELTAGGSITTGAINTSAETSNSFSFSASAYGGLVSLTTLQPGGNITFDSINTRATSFSFYGSSIEVGGDVNISANGVIRGVGEVFLDNEPTVHTILTSVGNTNTGRAGLITIEHDGGVNNLPFIVGDASINGTKEDIFATENSQITPNSVIRTFPVLPNGGIATGTPNGITIRSINTPPTLTANSQLPNTQQNQSITFRFGDLNPATTDINQDITTTIFDILADGTLTLQNGTPVTDGTVLRLDTILVYTPPTNTIGQIPAFNFRASDGVSVSAPQQISINVLPPPLPPIIEPPIIEPPIIEPPLKKLPDNTPNPESLQTLPAPPQAVVTNFPKVELDNNLAALEGQFTQQFTQYLGIGTPKLTSLPEARDILQKVEDATGVKPALIYVSFVPSTVPAAVKESKLIEAKTDSDRLDIVVVTAKGKPIRKVVNAATRKQVLEVTTAFTSTVTDRELGDAYQESSQQLYNWLIAPIETDLKARGINNLVFVMDAGLRSLPVAALYDGKQYLVERYSVGLMPSLSLTDTRFIDIRNAEVLGMGASTFTNQKPLPAVPAELSVITKQLWQGNYFLNEAFTLKNLQLQRQQKPFGIVHLATHGQFKPGVPGDSYIQLWDRQLRMDELRQLGWNNPPVQLVVLSACRTALGDEQAELGFAGFAVQAGAKSALASLWNVSDEGTFGMMTDFYEQLKQAPIKAEALRQTQIAMLKGQVRLEDGMLRSLNGDVTLPPALADLSNQDFRHPYFWSAFTMIGNPW